MSARVSFLLIVAVALGFGGIVHAQPAPPPVVGDISVDPKDATPLEEVRKLVAAGRTKQALAFADEQLAKNPRNAQMRFVRGVLLTDMNDNDAARAVFQQLTEDFPELPEPYNNLAVLYAADGQLDRARAALELALLRAAGLRDCARKYGRRVSANGGRCVPARSDAATEQSRGVEQACAYARDDYEGAQPALNIG